MSSSVDKKHPRLYRSVVHPLLAVSVPFLFLLCLDGLVRSTLPIIQFPPALFLPALALVGVEVTAMGNLFFDERAGFAARLRELVVVLGLMYVVLAIILSIESHVLTAAHTDLIYPLILVCLQWLFTALIHKYLREREVLFSALSGKGGERMLHALRDASFQASVSLRALRSVRHLLATFQGIVFIFLAVLLTRGIPIGIWRLLLCGLHAVYGFIILTLLNTFSQNQLLLGEGIVVPAEFEGKRVVTALGVLAICLPLVLLISRNAAPLSPSLLLSLLEKLGSLFPARSGQDVIRRMQELLEMRFHNEQQFNTPLPNVPINPFLFLYIEFIRRLFITVAGAALYFFLTSPLLSQDFLESLIRRNILNFLKKKLLAFLRFLLWAFHGIIGWLFRMDRRANYVRDRKRMREDREAWRRARDRKVSLRKRIQVGKVIKAFLLLLEWGESRGICYRSFETPQEYIARLQPSAPGWGPQLALIVEVLEEALFSSHLVDRLRMSGYYSAIREIRRSNGPIQILSPH